MSYTGSVELISGITPKNGRGFPLVNAPDVYVDETHRLPDALSDIHEDIDDKVSDLKSDFSDVIKDNYYEVPKEIIQTSNGWKLKPDGLCESNVNYKLNKYSVEPGNKLKIVSDDYFQFQNSSSVPSTGTSTRIGETYTTGSFYVIVPVEAQFLIVSTQVENSGASVSLAYPIVEKLSSDIIGIEDSLENDLDTILNKIGKNLIGPEKNTLYPVRLHEGQAITVSLTNYNEGDQITINTFGKDTSTRTHYWVVSTSGRTITIPDDVYYISFSNSGYANNAIAQVELGDTATDFEEYVPSNKDINAKIATLNDDIADINDNISSIIIGNYKDISPQTSASGYIGSDGGYHTDSNYSILKYSVTAGSSLYLDIPNPYNSTNAVFQFQNNSSVPYSPNSYVIGEPVTENFKGVVTVPEGASWLMVVILANTSNHVVKVKDSDSSTDEIKADVQKLSETVDFISANTVGKNLIGPNKNVLYPIRLHSGQKITVSLTNNEEGDQITFNTFNEDTSTRSHYWAVPQTNAAPPYRTITIPDDVYYISFSNSGSANNAIAQVELGDTATEFEEYVPRNIETSINEYDTELQEDLKYKYKLFEFKKHESQYQKGNTTGTWYDRFNLFHITDNHVGPTFSNRNLSELSKIANDIGFDAVVNSGDMTIAGNVDYTRDRTNAQFDTFTQLSTTVLSTNIPVLATLGNHDANDPLNGNILNASTKEDQWTHVFEPIKEKYPQIIFGNESGYKHYSYYDITKNGRTLRVITLDSLDHPDYQTGDTSYICQSNEVFSQEQINWLCNTALNVPNGTYAIIINNHFPFAPRRAAGYSDEHPALNDGTFVQGWTMIPDIIEAWTNRTTLSRTYSDAKNNAQNISVNADFTNIPSGAIFVCYMTGHTHSKNSYTVHEEGGHNYNQLMLCEDSSGMQGNALNRTYKYDNGIENTAASAVSIDIAQRKIYRTAYGAFQNCNKAPISVTEIFEF